MWSLYRKARKIIFFLRNRKCKFKILLVIRKWKKKYVHRSSFRGAVWISLKCWQSFFEMLFLCGCLSCASDSQNECVRMRVKMWLLAINLEYAKHTKSLKWIRRWSLVLVIAPVHILEEERKKYRTSSPSAFWDIYVERFQTKNRS